MPEVLEYTVFYDAGDDTRPLAEQALNFLSSEIGRRLVRAEVVGFAFKNLTLDVNGDPLASTIILQLGDDQDPTSLTDAMFTQNGAYAINQHGNKRSRKGLALDLTGVVPRSLPAQSLWHSSNFGGGTRTLRHAHPGCLVYLKQNTILRLQAIDPTSGRQVNIDTAVFGITDYRIMFRFHLD